MAPRSYTEYVNAQSARNPCLRDLCSFLDADITRNRCRFVCLEFSSQGDEITFNQLDIDGVEDLLDDREAQVSDVKGRILFVEDLSKDIIELMGSRLHIDPIFFASHLHGQKMELTCPKPSLALLPSKVRRQNFVSLPYQRSLQFTDASKSLRRLSRNCNVPRKVMMLPPTKEVHIGFVQHCCSVLLADTKANSWLGIVLVDAPLNNIYRSSDQELLLNTQLFQGGYEDFADRSSFDTDEQQSPTRESLLDDLIHYWSSELPPFFDPSSATLLNLSYYPLHVIAGEWTRYIAVLSSNIKQYEYTSDIPEDAPSLTFLDTNLRSLQVWGRRCIQTVYKLDLVSAFLQAHISMARNASPNPNAVNTGDPDAYTLLAADYKHITTQIEVYQHRLEALIPVVTSLVQIVDTRRSLREAANVTRLTNLALLFVPLSFVTGLFSMQDGVEALVWWRYFCVAIPLCLLVFAAARVPERWIDKMVFWGVGKGRMVMGIGARR